MSDPLSQAILKKAKELSLAVSSVSQFKNIAGKGIMGNIDDKNYFLGSEKYINENDIIIPNEIKNELEHLKTKPYTLSFLTEK